MTWKKVRIVRRRLKTRVSYQFRWTDPDGTARAESVGSERPTKSDLRERERRLNMSQEPVRVREARLLEFALEHLRLISGRVSDATEKEHREVLDRFGAFCGDKPMMAITSRKAEEYLAWRIAAWRIRWIDAKGKMHWRSVSTDKAEAELAFEAKASELAADPNRRKRRIRKPVAWLHHPVKPATVNKDLRTLRAIFRLAVERGYLRQNPFAALKAVRLPQRDLRVLSLPEVVRLIKACEDPQWEAFVFLALTTGMRAGELCWLEWSDVDLPDAMLTVRCKAGHSTKSRLNRPAPLVPLAVKMLSGLPRISSWVFTTSTGRRWRNNLRRGFGKIVERAGIAPCTLHDLRRTFASHLATGGENQEIIRRAAGHASATTTAEFYQNIPSEALRRAPLRLAYAESAEIVAYLSHGREEGREKQTA